MYDTTTLITMVNGYIKQCEAGKRKPTYKGMGNVLGVSNQTIANVVHGAFNGKRYTEHPHSTRVIDNNDFQILQRLFDSREDLSV